MTGVQTCALPIYGGEIHCPCLTELLNTKQVTDPTFKAVVGKFGEKGAVDLTIVIGYYQLVCSVLNLDGYPLPDGAQPELKPLR